MTRKLTIHSFDSENVRTKEKHFLKETMKDKWKG